VNRNQRRAWRRQPGADLYTPGADQSFTAPEKAPLQRLSSSEARERFANFLVEGGMPREKADKKALETSARVCRKEDFQL
jgi:hypothetical protein